MRLFSFRAVCVQARLQAEEGKAAAEAQVAALEAECARRFGDAPLPAVQLQRRQLAWRLGRFARVQAARSAAGWRIQQAEWSPSGRVTLDVDGDEVLLSGQVDRIDRHEDGRWAILDYKFGENPKAPEKTHYRSGKWIGVQLPLYAYLAHEVVGDELPELGHFNMPATEAGCEVALATRWDEEAVGNALEAARDVVREVRAQLACEQPSFPLERPMIYDPVLADVCGEGLLTMSEGDE